MPITAPITAASGETYGGLKSDVASYLARTDLTQQIPRFIKSAESDLCNDLRIRGMEAETSLTVQGDPIALPADYLGMRRLYLDVIGTSRELEYLPPERFYTARLYEQAGDPQAYTIESGSIIFAPAASVAAPATVKMLYLAPYAELSDDADTNNVLDKHYQLYLYGALKHGFSYTRDDEQAGKYGAEYQSIVDRLNHNANRERFFSNGLIRTGVFTP